MRLCAAMLWLVACGGPEADGFGEHPADQVSIAGGALSYLSDAGPTNGAVQVSDLLDKDLGYTSAPDPSAAFAAAHATHADRVVDEAAFELKVLSYNAGLLDRKYLLGSVLVPEFEVRLAAQPDLLMAEGAWHVILLQEVWDWEDVQVFSAAASEHGYSMWAGEEKVHEEHGLIILVKDGVFDEQGAKTEAQFEGQYKAENWPGPNLKRGYLTWTLSKEGRQISLVNTHLVPFVKHYWRRGLQARELGLAVRALPSDVVVLGGDLNAGTYYPNDTWLDGDEKQVESLWAHASMYPMLLHYGELYDAVNAAAVHRDVELGATVPWDKGEALTEQPLSDQAWCDAAPRDTFTAWDCNTLHFGNYAGEGPPERLDHLMVRDAGAITRVASAAIEFTDVRDLDGTQTEVSDHYGVSMVLEISP